MFELHADIESHGQKINSLYSEIERLKAFLARSDIDEGRKAIVRCELSRVVRRFVSKQSTSWRRSNAKLSDTRACKLTAVRAAAKRQSKKERQ